MSDSNAREHLDAAQSLQTSASHKQHVKDVAAEILEMGNETDDESESAKR